MVIENPILKFVLLPTSSYDLNVALIRINKKKRKTFMQVCIIYTTLNR